MRYLIISMLFLFACQSKEINSSYILKHPGGIVNDYDNVFNENHDYLLSKKLKNYEKKTQRQIVVITVTNIEPYTDIVKFATDIGNNWGVGQKDVDNGLVVVLCKPTRQVGIATGTRTEKHLTNEICTDVIQNIMIPKFKKDKYFEGINDGIDALMEKWD